MLLLIYLLVGAIAGLLAGLFGIGGGVIVVPALVFAFTLQGIDPNLVMHMAVATSLANIVFTALTAIYTHQKKQAIVWSLAKPVALGMLLGAFIGVNTAIALPSHILQAIFGVFVIYLGGKMLLLTQRPASKQLPNKVVMTITGTLIGWASALFGIGGGNLLVAWLVNRGVLIKQAVATAAACGLAIGLVGATTNIILGQNIDNLPSYALGYVYLPALLGILLTSAISAHFGARLAHKMPAQWLQFMFAVLLILVGIRMLSSFIF